MDMSFQSIDTDNVGTPFIQATSPAIDAVLLRERIKQLELEISLLNMKLDFSNRMMATHNNYLTTPTAMYSGRD